MTTDDLHSELSAKVIHIFQRHHRGEQFHTDLLAEGGELVISPDGFNYVTFKPQEPHEVEDLREVALKRHYIVKMLESHKDHHRLSSYHVPGERLEEFLRNLDSRPGHVLEIRPFLPDTMA